MTIPYQKPELSKPYPLYHNRYQYTVKKYKIPRNLKFSLLWIFLVCITVYWLPYIISNIIGISFYGINEDMATLAMGISLCILTLVVMYLMRINLDRPTLRDYGISDENIKDNLILTAKLIFIIFAIETLVVLFFQYIGVSFEGGPEKIDYLFIITAVIVAPIFEETVYRMNASTLLVNRLPIIWVAWITSSWFIIKHFPMWFFDDNFGIPAIIIIILVDLPLWTIVTYFYLSKRSIWIPFLVHVFNNASIALFFYLPGIIADIIGFSFVIIGIIFLIAFGLPWVYKSIIKPISKGIIKFNKKTKSNLMISLFLIFLFLITTEALVSLSNITELICIPLGFLFLIVAIITFVYVIAQGEDLFVKK